MPFTPTRTAALDRLTQFLPSAGRDYARLRNFDHGPADRSNVSTLSPYVRHRAITEEEIVRAVLQRHPPSTAEKFVQEVCWRTYWKGWLEQRPGVWTAYVAECARDRQRIDDTPAYRRLLDQAEAGETAIECFNAWALELVETGYLHNHARMWFASIWIFTLKLPWTLGAEFFHHHLLDGDPASNTLSWRWVAGLQTRGKTYLARPDNIATYTGGRFNPRGDLAAFAEPLDEIETFPRTPIAPAMSPPKGVDIALLLTDDDLNPESWPVEFTRVRHVALLTGNPAQDRFSTRVGHFKAALGRDALARATRHFNCPATSVTSADVLQLATRLSASGVRDIVAPRPNVGPDIAMFDAAVADMASGGLAVHCIRRRWDDLFWPHATAGFFQLKDKIPTVLVRLGVLDPSAAVEAKSKQRR